MNSLQLLFRVSHAALFLIFCLKPGINEAQEDVRKVVNMNLSMPETFQPNEEVSVKVTVSTELRECMVAKASLESDVELEYSSFEYVYTFCLCNDTPRTLYWDFYPKETMKVKAKIAIIREFNICPDNMAVIPIQANVFYLIKYLYMKSD